MSEPGSSSSAPPEPRHKRPLDPALDASAQPGGTARSGAGLKPFEWALLALAEGAAPRPSLVASPAGGELPWHALPAAAHPSAAGVPAARVVRKAAQISSLVNLARQLLAEEGGSSGAGRRRHIVDFGGGTGALALPLAAMMLDCDVTIVDVSSRSLVSGGSPLHTHARQPSCLGGALSSSATRQARIFRTPATLAHPPIFQTRRRSRAAAPPRPGCPTCAWSRPTLRASASRSTSASRCTPAARRPTSLLRRASRRARASPTAPAAWASYRAPRRTTSPSTQRAPRVRTPGFKARNRYQIDIEYTIYIDIQYR